MLVYTWYSCMYNYMYKFIYIIYIYAVPYIYLWVHLFSEVWYVYAMHVAFTCPNLPIENRIIHLLAFSPSWTPWAKLSPRGASKTFFVTTFCHRYLPEPTLFWSQVTWPWSPPSSFPIWLHLAGIVTKMFSAKAVVGASVTWTILVSRGAMEFIPQTVYSWGCPDQKKTGCTHSPTAFILGFVHLPTLANTGKKKETFGTIPSHCFWSMMYFHAIFLDVFG